MGSNPTLSAKITLFLFIHIQIRPKFLFPRYTPLESPEPLDTRIDDSKLPEPFVSLRDFRTERLPHSCSLSAAYSVRDVFFNRRRHIAKNFGKLHQDVAILADFRRDTESVAMNAAQHQQDNAVRLRLDERAFAQIAVSSAARQFHCPHRCQPGIIS